MDGERCTDQGNSATDGLLGHAAIATWAGMAHVVQTIEQAVASLLAEHGLNLGQYDILMNVVAVEGLTQQELADRLCHSKANVSQLIDKMERGGLVRRVPHGRAYRLSPTDTGRALVGQIGPQLEQRIAARFAILTPSEHAELHRAVDKLATGDG